jgi:hypothetical protein
MWHPQSEIPSIVAIYFIIILGNLWYKNSIMHYKGVHKLHWCVKITALCKT